MHGMKVNNPRVREKMTFDYFLKWLLKIVFLEWFLKTIL